MRKKHEDYLIESHEEWTSYLQLFIYLSSCLDESSREFKSILSFNTLTQLEYLIQTSWLNLNTRFQNSDSNQVLTSWKFNSISMTQLDVISLDDSNKKRANKYDRQNQKKIWVLNYSLYWFEKDVHIAQR